MTKFGASMLAYIIASTIEGTSAQTVADHDAVIKEILAEGTQRSRLYSVAQSLIPLVPAQNLPSFFKG